VLEDCFQPQATSNPKGGELMRKMTNFRIAGRIVDVAMGSRGHLRIAVGGLALAIVIIGNGIVQASNYSDAVVASGALGYWQLNDNTLDSGTAGNNGTWMGPGAASYDNGPLPSDGFLGMDAANRAADFSPNNQPRWIQIDDSAGASIYDFEYSDDFSLAIWLKKTAGDPDNDFLFAKEEAANQNQGYYLFRETGSFGPAGTAWKMQTAQAETAAIHHSAGTGPVDDGNWHLIVGTNNGGADTGHAANDMTLYIDGAPVGVQIAGDNLNGANTVHNLSALNIGSRETGSVATDNSLLDEAAIWSRELSANDVAALWSAATTIPEPSSLILILLGCSVLLSRRRSR
jgi:hypothetical protein